MAEPGRAQGSASPCADPLYVYALVRGSDAVLAALPPHGVDPLRPVTVLGVGSVGAVVSVVRAELFGEAAVRKGLDDQAWLATHVLAHQRVLDTLVASGEPLIPMRFCTIYPDAARLCRSLERHSATFAAELQRLQGKQEWGVKQIVDIQALQTAIGQGHPALTQLGTDGEIERLRKQIAGLSTGAAFLLKKKLTNLIAEWAQTFAFGLADTTLRALRDAALDAVTSDLPKDRPEVCLNAAFWVQTEHYGEFLAQLEQLGATFGPLGVRYELSGPWPPHHFLRLALDAAPDEVFA
jgi:hypothetical protein